MPFKRAGVQRCFDTGLVNGTLYLALHDADGGEPTSSNEVTGAGYSRKSRTLSDWAQDGVECRCEAFDFNAAAASWGTPDTLALWTASTGGTLLLYYTINPALVQAIASGDSVSAQDNDFRFEIPVS